MIVRVEYSADFEVRDDIDLNRETEALAKDFHKVCWDHSYGEGEGVVKSHIHVTDNTPPPALPRVEGAVITYHNVPVFYFRCGRWDRVNDGHTLSPEQLMNLRQGMEKNDGYKLLLPED